MSGADNSSLLFGLDIATAPPHAVAKGVRAAYGVAAAADSYFGKELKDLLEVETTLADIKRDALLNAAMDRKYSAAREMFFTGGGLHENLERILPEDIQVTIDGGRGHFGQPIGIEVL